MSGLISAVGLVFILQVLVGQIWGLGLNKPVPYAYRGVVKPLGVPICYHDLIVILVSVGLMIILWIFLNRIRLGQGMRAVSQDSIAASLQGISINKMGLVAMGTGCAFAGLAGALSAPLVTVNPYMGGTIILKAFLIVIVGGVGSIGGTILASLLFAFLDTVITRLADSTIANMIGLLLMLGILTFRPKGLLGRE